MLKKLKKYGTTIYYPRTPFKVALPPSIVLFADAARKDENGQIGVIVGLVVGEGKEGSVLHTLNLLSHKSRRPMKSVPAAEIIAAAKRNW